MWPAGRCLLMTGLEKNKVFIKKKKTGRMYVFTGDSLSVRLSVRLSHTHTHTHTLSLSLSLSLSHTNTHTRADTYILIIDFVYSDAELMMMYSLPNDAKTFFQVLCARVSVSIYLSIYLLPVHD